MQVFKGLKLKTILPIFLFAALMTWLIWYVIAAGPFVSVETESTSLNGNVVVKGDSTASAGSYLAFGVSSDGNSVSQTGVGAAGGSVGSGVTYANRTYTINPGDGTNWNTHIANAGPGAILGITAGTHSGSKVHNVRPLTGQKFIGQTDGVPTIQFPNGTPTTIIDGQENGALDNGSKFISAAVDDVTIENLEVKNFAPPHGGGDVFGADASKEWLIYNNYIHHVQRAIKLGLNFRVAHNLVEYAYNGSIFSSSWWDGSVTHRNGGGMIEDNTFQHINTDHDAWNILGGEASTKFAGGSNEKFLIRYNTYKDHYGPAVWFDAYLHSSLEQEYAEIHNNFFENNLIGFKWEIMGVQSADHRVGVNFHHNYLKNTGTLFGNPYERLIPVDVNESQGSTAHPIRINDNRFEFASPHRFGAAASVSVNADARGYTDWFEMKGNTIIDSGTLGPDSGDTKFMVGLFSWNNWGGPELWNRNFTFEDNNYTYRASVYGSSGPFGKVTRGSSGNTTWAGWNATNGFDTTRSSYSEN